MEVVSANYFLTISVTILLASSFCQNLEHTTINFSSSLSNSNSNKCPSQFGNPGVCVPITACPEIKKLIKEGIKSHLDTTCGWQGPSIPLVCCPYKEPTDEILLDSHIGGKGELKINRISDKTTETPVEGTSDFIYDYDSTLSDPERMECNIVLDQFEKIEDGASFNDSTEFFNVEIKRSANSTSQSGISAPPVDPRYQCGRPQYFSFEDLRNIYCGNDTAEKYKKMGFTITPLEVDVDMLVRFRASNATHTAKTSLLLFAVGGIDARRVLTVYMALLGYTTNGKTKWLCDGVIINRNWILTAAHCIIDRDPDVIRLGEYDLSNDTDSATEFPMDFGVKGEGIFYPGYEHPYAYHDLALLQLDREIPYHRNDMRPICLPWGDEVNRVFTGEPLTLTGWGAVAFGGRTSSIVQEVNITAFDTAACDENYKKEPNFYSLKFPRGIHSETTLCAGDIEGGKDACQGDSGGPVVYLKANEESDFEQQYTLAGIVSTGFGCGLKDFPGIYVPINRPQYLSWIKKVAFA